MTYHGYSIVVGGKIVDDILSVSAADVSTQLATGVTNGRSMFFLQWALTNAADAGVSVGPVDGTMRPSVQTALDSVRSRQYGTAEFAPLTGPKVSRAFLAALFADWLDTQTPKNVVA